MSFSGGSSSLALSAAPPREWFTAAELAELALPGLPADKRAINRRAQEERWTLRHDAQTGELLVRTRAGRGGGLEYHFSLLPGAAQIDLAQRGIGAANDSPPAPDASLAGGWAWLEIQPEKVRAEAARRAALVREIELLEQSGTTRTAAISAIAARSGTGKSTLWNWLRAVEGIAPVERLPALAPRHKGGGCEVEIAPILWTMFKSDFLRLSAPTLTSCYERTAVFAAENRLFMPSERTFRRRLEKEIDPRIITLRRKGEEALRRSIPAQRRTVAHLHALEHVNVDGHKFDVFVKLDDGRVIRPIMVAIQDIFSRKMLGWRIGEVESAVLTRLAFADVFRNYGIPKACTLDNGRAFASKWITGGAKSRFRFKIREEEPTGLLTGLGIAIHWALPFRGQSKPIERGFRDLCDTIAKHPAMEGAYTGNNPMAKPENYGSRAVPMARFLELVDQGMAAHNARIGRRTETARGRSFDQTFAESYAAAPVGKATAEQLRLALLTAEQVRVNKATGEVALFGNRYWSEQCSSLHGERVTVRFDPDNLHSEIFLYSTAGRFLTAAPIIDDTGFNDAGAAQQAAKRVADYRKTVRAAADAEGLLVAEELAALQAQAERVMELPAPAVLRPVRHRGQTAAALKTQAAPEIARPNRALNVLRLIGGDE